MEEEFKIQIAERCGIMQWSPIREIFEMAERMTGLIRLEVGEPDFETPQSIIDAGKASLERGDTKYTSTAGIYSLREAVAQKYLQEHGIKADPESEVMISTGGAASLNLALQAVINPGDEVLVPDPGWPQYIQLVKYAGGVPVYYSLKNDDPEGYAFKLITDRLEEKLTDKTRALIINFPSNPTGAVMQKSEGEGLADFVKKNNLVLISDEVYEKVVYDGYEFISAAALPGMFNHTVVLGSASKSYAMTGWRVGYGVGPKEVISELSKLQSLTTICPNAMAQHAYRDALQGDQGWIKEMVGEYRERRDYLVDSLNMIPGISCSKPLGTFYVFPDITGTGISDFDFSRMLLEQHKVTSVPGSGFGPSGKGFVRFSYANSLDNIKLAVERINEFVTKLNR